MAVRCYVVPQNDPNGHAGQTWCTDDAGNFWPQRPGDPAPGATNPATSPTAPSTAPTPPANPGAGAGAVVGATGGYVDPTAIKALMDLASQNAQQAYLNARLELEKQTAGQAWTAKQEELAQAAAHDAWQKTIAGREADVQEAATTGYVGGVNQVADRVSAAWNRLPPEQRTGANAVAIWKTQVPGLTDAEAAAMNDAAHQFAAVNGTAMPADIVGQTLAAVTNGRITGQTATLSREQEQNKTGLGLLDLASRLRGPDNAFAYAQTLQNVPPAMRAQLDAMMQRAGISYGGPGLGAVAGQISQGGLGGMTQQAQATPGMGPTVGLAGATQQTQPTMMMQPGAGGMPVLRAGGQTQTGGVPVGMNPTAAPAGAPTQMTPVQPFQGSAPNAGGFVMPQTAVTGADTAAIQAAMAAQQQSGGGYQQEMNRQTGGNYMTYTGPQSPSANGVTGPPATPPTDLGATQQAGNAMVYQGASTGGQPVQHLSQMSPQQWNNTNDYVKRLMLSGLEAQGQDKSAETSAYQMSLPRYGGPSRAVVRV